jgi:proprotein convertase subtilisin/kexin type 5
LYSGGTGTLTWYVTFYNVPYEHYDIQVSVNTLSVSGISCVANSTTCLQTFDATTIQTTSYIGCVTVYCWNVVTSQCEQPSHCAVCSSIATGVQCTTCQSYYYLNASTLCASCITGCLVCSNNTTCTTCDTANNYFLVGTICGSCS